MSGAPSLAPNKERGRFTRTDSGRDVGPSYTSQMSVSGDVPIYANPDGMSLIFAAVLGANADSGTTPNYTHTITPASDGLWVTCWRMVGNVILEKYTDCKITALRMTGSAGSPIEITLSIVGITSTFLASDPVLTPLSSQPYIYPEAQGAIKVDTVSYPISSINFGIDNNMSGFQADDYIFSDIDPGGRDVSLGASLRFTGAIAQPLDYRAFYYGSDAGTAQSAAVGTHVFDLTFTRNANLSLNINLPQVTWAAVPVQPDPGGDPIGVDLATAVEPPSGGGNIATVVIKDQNSTLA